MAEIINLNDLIPDDIEMQYGDKVYVIPGDLDTETVLKVFKVFQAMLELVGKADASEAEVKKAAKDMSDMLLSVFRIRDPQLEKLPFGRQSTTIVVSKLLQSLGLDVGGDAAPPTIPAAANRSQRRKPRSSPPKRPSHK